MSSPATSELQSSLRELSIGGGSASAVKDIPRPTVQTSSKPKKKTVPIADSWEDEASSSSSSPSSETEADADADAATGILSPAVSATAEGPLDPPPTPISPQSSSQTWTSAPTSAYTSVPPSSGSSGPTSRAGSRSPAAGASAAGSARRPEKQTAVAGRMIAGALGIRAPKRTEEQRAYDRAVKEQEIKRKNREKEDAKKAAEEEEKAKAAVWDD